MGLLYLYVLYIAVPLCIIYCCTFMYYILLCLYVSYIAVPLCNVYCFSMATAVARTHLNDTFVRTLLVLLRALFNDAVNCIDYTGCFKKSFTTLKAYRNLYRGRTQRFELSKCSKTHRVLPRIVMVRCDFHW